MSYEAKREALEDHCTRERSKKYARKNNDTSPSKEENDFTQSTKTNGRPEVTDSAENDHPEIVTETEINMQVSQDGSIARGDASTLTSTGSTTLSIFHSWTKEDWKKQQREAGAEMQKLVTTGGYIAVTKFDNLNVATEIVKKVSQQKSPITGQLILRITPGMSTDLFIRLSMVKILTPKFNRLRHHIQTAMKKRYTGEER